MSKKCLGGYMKDVIRKGLPDDEERFQECLNCKDAGLCQGTRIVAEQEYIPPSLRGRYIEMGILDKDDPRVSAPARDSK